MHWCQDETTALLASVPFLGYFLLRFRLAWRAVFKRGQAKHIGCTAGHVHHPAPSVAPVEQPDNKPCIHPECRLLEPHWHSVDVLGDRQHDDE